MLAVLAQNSSSVSSTSIRTHKCLWPSRKDRQTDRQDKQDTHSEIQSSDSQFAILLYSPAILRFLFFASDAFIPPVLSVVLTYTGDHEPF